MLKLGLEAITMQIQYMRNDLSTSKGRSLTRSASKRVWLLQLVIHSFPAYLLGCAVNRANKPLLRISKPGKTDSNVECNRYDPSMLDHTLYLFAQVIPSMVDV